jgi:hypothetical protein
MSAIPSRWYWVHDGRQGGPVTWDELQGLARRGSLRASDLVLREGTQDWKPAATARADESAAAAATTGVRPPPPIPVSTQIAQVSSGAASNAEELIEDAPPPQKSRRGLNRMMIGTGLFLGGIFLTYVSYQASQAFFGGRFIVFRGLIILGIIQFVRGIAEAGSDG